MNFDFDVITKDWGKEKIEAGEQYHQLIHMRPVEIHHKADGTLDDGPVFCFVFALPAINDYAVYGQISLEMLNRSLGRLGYQINRLQ